MSGPPANQIMYEKRKPAVGVPDEPENESATADVPEVEASKKEQERVSKRKVSDTAEQSKRKK